jgi:NADH-quinone oxidoreductase subunit L
MAQAIWLIPAVPFAGFLILALAGSRLTKRAVAWIGVGTIGSAAALAVAQAAAILLVPPARQSMSQLLWVWLDVDRAPIMIGLELDQLSLVFVLVITVVGFLIHLYSAEHMEEDEDYSRFFAYMNLFVGMMLTLVMADNLLLLYLGWEGVGLCSYLLIGFWYRDPVNGRAAIKAFVVTRVGDASLAVALALLYLHTGTLNLGDSYRFAVSHWQVGGPIALAAAALLLGGAVGKSAQLPLQTWLPDAMAGPTPVSALIHAATMVTAGVYLIARMHVFFELAPAVQLAVAVLGAATLLLGAVSALAQWDVKRVLAYSTISQIGYMFLGLGVGAWSAAIFHFVTHAFFKSLLFLAAGALITAMHEEHSIFKMGGLRRKMPLVFWTFLAGACSLSALPLTAGFYSKDEILAAAWQSEVGGQWLWAIGIAGALLTAAYSFRMIFVIFFGEARKEPAVQPGWRVGLPLVLLAVAALAAGTINLPRPIGGRPPLGEFLAPAFQAGITEVLGATDEPRLRTISGIVALVGIFLAWLLYSRFRASAAAAVDNRPARALREFWLQGWGFDWLYAALFVRPFKWIARVNRDDAVDLLPMGLAQLAAWVHRGLSRTQTGEVRWYVAVLTLGVILLVALVVLR